MRTVPLDAARALLAARPDLGAQCTAGILVGGRVEVDLDPLDPALAGALERFWARTTHLTRATGPPMVTTRALISHRQVSSQAGRHYLADVYRALLDTPDTSAWIRELTAARPNERALDELGTWQRTDDGAYQVCVDAVAGGWPDELGGPPWPAEIARQVTIVTRHAPWRDVRVRRLVAVDVTLTQVWADPNPDLAGLPHPCGA